MIKVQIGETLFFCDSPQDAADIAKIMGGNSATSKAKDIVHHSNEVSKLLSIIKSFPSTTVSSETLSNALNLDSVHGLGPKMRGLSRRFEATYQLPLEEILTREGRPGQPIVWRVNKGKLENMDFN